MTEREPGIELNPNLDLSTIKGVLSFLEGRVSKNDGLNPEETERVFKVLADLRDDKQKERDEIDESIQADLDMAEM